MDNLAQLEWEAASLRHHVALANFAEAEAAAHRYAEAAARRMRALPPTDAAETLRQSCDLLEWGRRNLCAARARLAGQLHRLHTASRYAPEHHPPAHTWKIEA